MRNMKKSQHMDTMIRHYTTLTAALYNARNFYGYNHPLNQVFSALEDISREQQVWLRDGFSDQQYLDQLAE